MNKRFFTALLFLVLASGMIFCQSTLVSRYVDGANKAYVNGNNADAFKYINMALGQYEAGKMPDNVISLAQAIYSDYLRDVKVAGDTVAFAEFRQWAAEFPSVIDAKLTREMNQVQAQFEAEAAQIEKLRIETEALKVASNMGQGASSEQTEALIAANNTLMSKIDELSASQEQTALAYQQSQEQIAAMQLQQQQTTQALKDAQAQQQQTAQIFADAQKQSAQALEAAQAQQQQTALAFQQSQEQIAAMQLQQQQTAQAMKDAQDQAAIALQSAQQQTAQAAKAIQDAQNQAAQSMQAAQAQVEAMKQVQEQTTMALADAQKTAIQATEALKTANSQTSQAIKENQALTEQALKQTNSLLEQNQQAIAQGQKETNQLIQSTNQSLQATTQTLLNSQEQANQTLQSTTKTILDGQQQTNQALQSTTKTILDGQEQTNQALQSTTKTILDGQQQTNQALQSTTKTILDGQEQTNLTLQSTTKTILDGQEQTNLTLQTTTQTLIQNQEETSAAINESLQAQALIQEQQKEAIETVLVGIESSSEASKASTKQIMIVLAVLVGLIFIGIIAAIISISMSRKQQKLFAETLRVVSELQRIPLEASSNYNNLSLEDLYSGMRALESANSDSKGGRKALQQFDKKEVSDELRAELRDLATACERWGQKIDKITNRKNNSKNVAELVFKIAQKMDLGEYTSMLYFCAAMVYDIGFLNLDENLLNKSSLTEEEKYQIRSHVREGIKLIDFVPEKFKSVFVEAILMHHENLDGSGYPDGLHDKQIPAVSRLIRVVESFIAQISKRNYHGIFDKETAISELRKYPERYDQTIVNALDTLI
ncbi:MAG: hypothetical protein MJ183_05540 [Treponemataceae bacterium]|nr:hypothetical protein [Treponemataceae bacterium]